MNLPTGNLEAAIHPFGFYLENVQEVDRGWIMEIHDYYNHEQFWNMFMPDFTDANITGVIAQIGVMQ